MNEPDLRYKQHQQFLKDQIFEAQQKFPNIRFFERHVGLFYTREGNPIKLNKPGMCDLWALLPIGNMTYHLEIEIKTGSGVLSKSQKIWQTFCAKMNIPFFLVNDSNHLVKQLLAFEVKVTRG